MAKCIIFTTPQDRGAAPRACREPRTTSVKSQLESNEVINVQTQCFVKFITWKWGPPPMPSPKITSATCTGCKIFYKTSRQQALKERHFHSSRCYENSLTGKPRSDRGSNAIWKTCEFCLVPYLAGGRSPDGSRLPNKTSRFHDKVCAGRAKVNAGKTCHPLDANFARWASSYFDGDGYLTMIDRGPGHRPYAHIAIGSKDPDVIQEFVRTTGVGSSNFRRAVTDQQADLFIWRCCANAALSFLRQIRPYLIIKHAIADRLLAWEVEMDNDVRFAYLPAWRKDMFQQVKDLNERGPKGAKARYLTGPSAAEQEFRSLPRGDDYICLRLFDNSKFSSVVSILDNSCLLEDQRFAKCESCGRSYARKRNPTLKNPRTTCSTTCAMQVRRRRGKPCCIINSIILPCLAGLIDTEGSIGIVRSSGTIHARVDFGNTDMRVVQLIHWLAGIGSISLRPPSKKTHSSSWHWRIQCDGAHGFIEQVYPFLRVKRLQASLAIYVQNRLGDPASRCDRAWQEHALSAIKILNKKGPRIYRLAPAQSLREADSELDYGSD